MIVRSRAVGWCSRSHHTTERDADVHHGDVLDPIGSELAVYERTYLVIRECIESMATKLHDFDGWKKTGKRGSQ